MADKVKDSELEEVSGGTTYSSCTYGDLNILGKAFGDGQRFEYHPVITTAINKCSLNDRKCYYCRYLWKSVFTLYCLARSKEYDPTK